MECQSIRLLQLSATGESGEALTVVNEMCQSIMLLQLSATILTVIAGA